MASAMEKRRTVDAMRGRRAVKESEESDLESPEEGSEEEMEGSEEEEEEEEGSLMGSDDYSEDDQNDDSEEEGSDEEEESPAVKRKREMPVIDSNVPLFELLKRKQAAKKEEEDITGHTSEGKAARQLRDKREKIKRKVSISGRTNKNAPSEQRSDRPVRRLRDLELNVPVRKAADPRFLDYTGEINARRFNEDYEFLDQQREQEVRDLQKRIKKTKDPHSKEALQKEINVMRQQLTERKIAKRSMQKLDEMRAAERDAVAAGKNPYYLKKSAKRAVVAEEKFKELKKTGKLQKFMEKKRRQNMAKERASMPSLRE